MKYFIQIKSNSWDNTDQNTILEVSGASEETLNLILSNYNGRGFIIKVAKEELELTSPEGIENLDLSIRSYNCLCRARIKTILDLIKIYNKGELINVRNLGRKSYDEVVNKLLILNLVIRRTEDER